MIKFRYYLLIIIYLYLNSKIFNRLLKKIAVILKILKDPLKFD